MWKLYKTINSTITAAHEISVKKNIDLFNFPNPFYSETTIYFSIPDAELINVKLSIFNCSGKLVHENTTNYCINNSIKFYGKGLQAGVYICLLSVGDRKTYCKMVLK